MNRTGIQQKDNRVSARKRQSWTLEWPGHLHHSTGLSHPSFNYLHITQIVSLLAIQIKYSLASDIACLFWSYFFEKPENI